MKNNLSSVTTLFIPLAGLFLFNIFIDSYLFLYDIIPSLDVPMHLLGGILTAWTVHRLLCLYKTSFKIKIEPRFLLSLYIIGMVALVAMTWEGYEFMHDMFFPRTFSLSAGDTIGDVFVGLLGASLYCILMGPLQVPKKRKKKK